ncbi:MAG: serine/threonine-protein kinase [bacterium]
MPELRRAARARRRDLPTCGVSLRLPDPREGLELGGRYRLEREIGRGGTSVVYRAEELATSRHVAVKILDSDRMRDPHAVARFRDEVAKARDIRHPHAAQILDFGQMTDGTLFMVMELVRGQNLSELLRREGTLPELRTIRVMKQVADVVGTAHRQGIVHRDLKPENIMVEPERNGVPDGCWCSAYGIAKLRGSPNDSNTRTGVLIGTPYYMSPEQCQGKPLDARSDVYSLGVVMYEALTGHRPFDTTSDSVIPLLMKHIGRPRPMRAVKPDLDVSRELERLVMGTLSKDPNWRPADGAEYAALDKTWADRMGKHLDRTPRTADEVRRAVAARERREDLVPRQQLARSRSRCARDARGVGGDRGRRVARRSTTLSATGSRHRADHPGTLAGGARNRPAPTPTPIPRLAPARPPSTCRERSREDVDLEGQALGERGGAFRAGAWRRSEQRGAWLGLGRSWRSGGPVTPPRTCVTRWRTAGADRRLDVFAIQASKLLEQIDQVDDLLDQARAAAQDGRTDEAVRSFRSYLETRTDDGPVWFELGRLLVSARRKTEAEVALRNAARYAPSDPQVHHELGALLLSLNRREDAIHELGFALELDPSRDDTRRYLRMARNSGSLTE